MKNKSLFVAIVSLIGLTGVGYASMPDYWPTQAWKTSTPEEQGMDSELLAKMIDYIRENELNIHSITIVRHGCIVLDAYFWPFTPLTRHDIASCTKSFTSTLFGIAIDKGYIKNVRVPFLRFFKDRHIANLDKNKSRITCENLLTMTSGLECINQPTEVTLNSMQASPDYVQYALDLPVTDEPGSKWSYNSCGSHLLGAIVTSASRMSLEEFGGRFLFDRIGIGQINWPLDPQGYDHGWGDLQMTPRDMARLGFLFLHDGQWNGEEVVSRRWVKEATTNHTKDFGPPDGYGYQWWTYKYGSYQAQGRGGQRIFVLPALDIVVVVTASVTGDESARYETALTSFILPSIKSRSRPSHPNPQAFTLLTEKLREISAPPPPDTLPLLPDVARRISGKTWILDSNIAGWQSARLEFKEGSNEAYITLAINGGQSRFPIGLDNIPRMTSGESFAAGSRYEGGDVTLRGRWNADTFIIEFNTLALIDRGTIKMNFSGDSADVELFEKTYIMAPVRYKGRLNKGR